MKPTKRITPPMPAELETPGNIFQEHPDWMELKPKERLALAHVFEHWAIQLKEQLAKSKRSPRFNHN